MYITKIYTKYFLKIIRMYPTASSMSKTTKHLKLDSLLKEVEIQVLISADEFLKVSKTRLLAHEKHTPLYSNTSVSPCGIQLSKGLIVLDKDFIVF